MVIMVVIIIIIITIIMIVTVICIVYQNGKTALMWASEKGREDMAQFLLDHGAGIDIQDNVSILYTIVCIYVYLYLFLCIHMYICMYKWKYE